ncbi:MAG: CHASE2 domain-containing protein [Gammaproteobacteria bacterium]
MSSVGQQRTELADSGKTAAFPGLLKGLALGAGTGIVGLLISALPFGQTLEENVGLDWLFGLRGVKQPPADVVVVSIDKASADALDLPNKPWKWPRALHASLIEKLVQANARVIAFDVFFEEPQRDRDDQPFARAIEEAGNVVLFEYLDTKNPPRTGQSDAVLITKRPIPVLARSAAALAPFPLPAVPEKKTQVWTFKGAGDVPTLPVVAFQIFALHAHDEFLALLLEASASHACKLTTDYLGVLQTQGVRKLIQKLREDFQKCPLLADRMLKALEDPSRANLSGKKKQILTSLIDIYQGEDSLYLNYYGPPQSITTVPYHKALQGLEGASARANFNGKAVFIGASELSPRQKDDFHTPYTSPKSGLKISGVEIAATVFANLLEGSYVRPLNPSRWHGIVLIWGLLIGIVCRLSSPAAAITGSLVLSACYFAVSYLLFKSLGIWCPIVVPLAIQSPVALFAAILWRYVDTNKERQNIRRAFGYYLPDKVVDQLAENVSDIRAKSQLVYGTCLSTDAEQYTSLSERMDPQELGAVMNSYYEAVFQPVKQHGGIVSDVIGDSMLAIWATSHPDSELRTEACLASLDIASAVERFNQSSDSLELPTRIGLHSGQMLLGSIGAVDHYEFRAVGDIVNTSTRIEGLNKRLGTRILVSEQVLEGLEGLLSRELGKFLLVGKSKPVVLHELIGRIEDCDENQRRLCTAFTSALAPFRMQRWEEARSRFLRLLEEHGQDGPSRFYLRSCEDYRNNPPTAAWDGVMSVQEK